MVKFRYRDVRKQNNKAGLYFLDKKDIERGIKGGVWQLTIK